MSWLTELAKTYDNCIALGAFGGDTPLLPLYHKTQNSHLCIKIDAEGNFIEAEPNLINGIIIPCTERSAAKANGINAHPLEDNLEYIAGDLSLYSLNDNKEKFDAYFSLLTDWKSSPYTNKKVVAVWKYINRKTLLKDLIDGKILFLDDAGKLIESGDSGLYKITPGPVLKALVRFSVIESGPDANPITECWKDTALQDSWVNYFKSTLSIKGQCYATGEETYLATIHPKYIRNPGDGGKLISSNDDSNFTFRGLFDKPEEAVGIGIELSQKAHLALKWLISNQSFVCGDLVYVFWAPANPFAIPTLESDLMDDLYPDATPRPDTGQEYGLAVAKMVAGYKTQIDWDKKSHKMNIIGLNSATTGRISVIYYRELDIDEFLIRLSNWYRNCCWKMNYFYEEKIVDAKGKEKTVKHCKNGVGTPIFKDIIKAAYGSDYSKINDKLKEKTIERLIHCVVDGENIPWDIVQSAIIRVIKPTSFESQNDWLKNMAITCAIYKKYLIKEDYEVALNEDRVTRDYLFGRLLAVADNIESWALSLSGEARETAATRYFSRFSVMPLSTWMTIELSLQPYIKKLDGAYSRKEMIGKIMAKFKEEDINDAPLGGEFLFGYHHQRQFLEDLKKSKNTNLEEK